MSALSYGRWSIRLRDPACDQRWSSSLLKKTLCAELSCDQLFKTDNARLTSGSERKLRSFFISAQNFQFVIVGHIDSRASDLYNMRLSKSRAIAVAAIGRSVGARILEVQAYGETQPKMSIAGAAGMAENRRVEIVCVT